MTDGFSLDTQMGADELKVLRKRKLAFIAESTRYLLPRLALQALDAIVLKDSITLKREKKP